MGKASIVYVIGLTLIIGVALSNINRASVDSMDTYTTYFGRTMSHNIALAAANIGAHRVLFNSAYSTSFSGAFNGGQYAVTYADTGSGSTQTRFLLAVGRYNAGGETIRDTVRAVFALSPVSLSRYGWFTEDEKNGYLRPNGTKGPFYGASDWKITGDSVFGFAHSNSKFNLAGQPYFDRKVTATNSPTLMTLAGKKDPIYNEGYEWGVSVERPSVNITTLKSVANSGSPFASYFQNNDVGLEFFAGGTVHVRIPYGTGTAIDTVVPTGSLSSSGVIGVTNGDVHVKGTYSGQVTVAAFTGTGSAANKGNVWVDGDILAANDPRSNPNSDDMMGLVAERMGYITRDNARNTSSILTVMASVYSQNGEFTAEDFWQIPKSGRFNLYGSMCQKTAGSLGVFGHAGIQSGMFYTIRHDPRLLTKAPPFFPFSTKFRLLAWWEN